MRSRLLALCAVAGVLAACSPRAPVQSASPTPSATRAGRGPWLHITGEGTAKQPVRFVAQAGNRKQYDLIAHSYESNGAQGASVATFFLSHIVFYGKHGTKLVADSQRAIVDETANMVTLTGNVRTLSGSGMTLDCDTLRYNRTTEMIHGEGHVVMTDPHGMRASGNSVDTDLTLTRARMQ
jgi:LPS export ABC transporter protein LptC